MSILLKDEIIKGYNNKTIHIKPFKLAHVGPNSYDVTISPILKIYDFSGDSGTKYLDFRKPNPTKEIIIPPTGYVLQPNILYLGSTNEEAGSSHFIPMYEGRSSLARLGLQSHISAGFGDIGFQSNWTLELQVVHPVKIYPNIRIGQVYFHRANQDFNNPENWYNGKYKSQKKPQESKSFLDV